MKLTKVFKEFKPYLEAIAASTRLWHPSHCQPSNAISRRNINSPRPHSSRLLFRIIWHHIESLYYDERPDSVYRREKTRQWWDTQRLNFDCYTSYFTEREIQRSPYPNQSHVVAMVQQLPLLEYVDEIDEIVDVYIKNFVMPHDAYGDAAHLAMASYHGVDYLLTWNRTHLANAFKLKHIDKINLRLGLETPLIVTPEQLFPEGNYA